MSTRKGLSSCSQRRCIQKVVGNQPPSAPKCHDGLANPDLFARDTRVLLAAAGCVVYFKVILTIYKVIARCGFPGAPTRNKIQKVLLSSFSALQRDNVFAAYVLAAAAKMRRCQTSPALRSGGPLAGSRQVGLDRAPDLGSGRGGRLVVDGAWSAPCGRVERAAVRQRCPPRGTGLPPCKGSKGSNNTHNL
jgi:hypothetical protein